MDFSWILAQESEAKYWELLSLYWFPKKELKAFGKRKIKTSITSFHTFFPNSLKERSANHITASYWILCMFIWRISPQDMS